MRSEIEKAQRRREYKAYLKSDIWKAVRGAAIYRAGGVCEWCKGTDLLQVHHKEYPKALGTETPEMLQVLCDPCHAEAHGRPYIIHKLSRERRAERKQRLRAIKAEASAVAKRKRQARAEYWKAKMQPTPSLKDRF